ncbi:LysR substrate-binding domain-containing protein [Rhodocista pekingensis]|uniref:LysR substrate-binding domain-containing protein n=1 Tax=Rhodocista pekingensis TaxID=201185 RepID=A0ABW2KZI0_9PROT
MNLRDLRYVVAIAEHRHFGRASEACHVSQPTLSGQLRKLEDRLGAPLFERTSKWVVPTALGQQVVRHARAALEQADAIEALARAARDPLAGPLRLGVIPTLSPYLMPLVLPELRQRHPGLTLVLWEDLTANLVERLRRHELDAALIATETNGEDLIGVDLFVEPFLAAVPTGHPLASRDWVSEDDLQRADMLVLADGHCLREQALGVCGAPPPGGDDLRAASLDTLVSMVSAGYGCTLVPALAAPGLERRGLVLRPVDSFGACRTVRLVWRPTFPRQKALDALAELVRGVVPADLADGSPEDCVGSPALARD